MIGGIPIGFAAPWVLAALVGLPLLWLILRAIPPAPIRRRFPGVVLLLGLSDEDTVTDRTPWWLLLLRSLALAAVIVGLAGPLLNPQTRTASSAPLLIVMDAGWASAPDWRARQEMVTALLDEAAREGRLAAVQRLSAPDPLLPLQFAPADAVQSRLAGVLPMAWRADAEMTAAFAQVLGETAFDTVWLSDGLASDGRAALLEALQARGSVRGVETGLGTVALMPPSYAEGRLILRARRSVAGIEQEVTVQAIGTDLGGAERVLATLPLRFEQGAQSSENALVLPSELRARLTRFEVAGLRSAGAVALSDDRLRRREVALIAGREDREGLQLLSPLHYLRQALVPTADVIEGALMDVLPANPDVIVMADIAVLSEGESAAILAWLEGGGVLLRFAGPALAASEVSRTSEDPLLPVRLRAGGRSVGGAMSWGEPKALAPFPQDSPFVGLRVPEDVTVTAQVMAQPDPTLADRVIASLSDGTPLVTRKAVGDGQVVLMHVTANAQWSGLPLSGLFVQMLDRLAVLSAAGQGSGPEAAAQLAGTTWQPVKVLDGFGRLQDAQTLPGVAGERLAAGNVGPQMPPGLYQAADKALALPVVNEDTALAPARWPASVPVEGLRGAVTTDLSGYFLAAALCLLALDVLASLWVSGRLWSARVVALAGAAVLSMMLMAPELQAQSSLPTPEVRAPQEAPTKAGNSREMVLGHVRTGNRDVDEIALAGLRGLSNVLYFRTSIEPAAPESVDLETDELAFYPFLYWPITPDQPSPSREAYAKLNAYLRSGGMILFDTRDADVAGFGASSPTGRKLQRLAAGLDIPALEPLPQDHVLTRTFYLLQDFPGRYMSRDVWVEAAPPDAEQVEGMPFRNLNDGVTPVVIGGNDWAAAWAVDRRGNTLFPVGRGRGGERQRELAYRFGVNLIMHVLTGNYKSDQVHVPALLDRLGQ
ncbi:DUF4159 domain-containing protein [Shimia marina]|uniref:N-terminal double-transmembrane domain protein n=1 Tax=Shimia marina TaxID=321267 RepID=A0A0P1EL47_9RHOB|nr:DUF4159 domain-containing protein [Shimia marina]CUH51182.1 hypothetical protein SHM7688_00616 [Shimia marina]SFD55772.1 N-terminal double-transmembrane domain-containing protein [Shimia marina]